MTSNQRAMLQGLLIVTVVLAAAEVRAEDLEAPEASAAAAPAASAGASPMGFGDTGQFVLSAERLFGYTWSHPSQGSTTSTFSVLANPLLGQNPYDWTRLGFDYFVSQSFSAGLAAGFSRTTTGNNSTNTFELAPRIGFGKMVGPWLGVWPRLGVTYVSATGDRSYLGLTIDLTAVVMVTPHLAFTLAPVANIGLTGKQGTADQKYTTLGLQFGLAIPF